MRNKLLTDLKNQLKILSEELNKRNVTYYCVREMIENDKLFKKLILNLSVNYGDFFKMKNGYISLDEYYLIWKSPDNEFYPIEDFNAPLVECNWKNLHFKILKENDK